MSGTCGGWLEQRHQTPSEGLSLPPALLSSGGRRNQEMRQPIERPGYARCSCRPGAKNAVSQVEPAAARPGNSGELVGVARQVLTDGLSQDRR